MKVIKKKIKLKREQAVNIAKMPTSYLKYLELNSWLPSRLQLPANTDHRRQ